ncbi:hypothetical protein COT42_07860 [Candidatus Saganbacteria bacterium CG08_land_8_20_14_0_20_45_16]|uniref:DUF4381 domain-containing protein n=1 Tax=Candidatus Saganbacteria bacterium CG08_land_8_20_14_0_20_45_16 TaxID=2014293 RepID=A0A2H0XUA2_UNCSA|nr:MAG: hypothetical protein COT42_07860 [Candidatus Saganbacteria bacterium CG08_land_8_20_14_0_20_45_16]
MNQETLRDIKGVYYQFDWETFLFLLLVILLLGAALYFALQWLSKRQKKAPAAEPIKAEPQKSFSELVEELNPEKHFEQKMIKEYYFNLTEIIRQYLAQNYRVETLGKTSLEIIEAIESKERNFDKVKFLDRFLAACDLVKFAKYQPTLVELKEKKSQALIIVKKEKTNAAL